MRKHLLKISSLIAVLPILLIPATVINAASAKDLLGQVAVGTGNTAQKGLPELIGNIINVVLSALGIFFVVVVVYAGFLYLSAGGEEEKVKKAKKLLSQSVIGIVIILLAFAISSFVIGSLANVTNSQPSNQQINPNTNIDGVPG